MCDACGLWSSQHCVHCTYILCVHKNVSQRIISIILFRTDEILWNFEGLFPKATQETTAVAFPTKPVQSPYLRCFILMTSCRTETETVSPMEKAWPFDCFCSHQSVALLYLCLCQGGRWIFWALFVFSLLPKCNLSETFYQVSAICGWDRRHCRQTRSCPLNDCAKNWSI